MLKRGWNVVERCCCCCSCSCSSCCCGGCCLFVCCGCGCASGPCPRGIHLRRHCCVGDSHFYALVPWAIYDWRRSRTKLVGFGQFGHFRRSFVRQYIMPFRECRETQPKAHDLSKWCDTNNTNAFQLLIVGSISSSEPCMRVSQAMEAMHQHLRRLCPPCGVSSTRPMRCALQRGAGAAKTGLEEMEET